MVVSYAAPVCAPVQEFLKRTQELIKLQVKHGNAFFNKAIDKVKDTIRFERQVAVATEAGIVNFCEKELVGHAKRAAKEELKHAPKGVVGGASAGAKIEGAAVTEATREVVLEKVATFEQSSCDVMAKWTAKDFSEVSLKKHFNKHVIDKAEWGINSELTLEQYAIKARELLNSPLNEHIDGFVSKNGFVFKYNKITNEFATAKPCGTIETLFRPKNGITYWEEQCKIFKPLIKG